MNQQYTLTALNQLTKPDFVDLLGSIYEHSSWVAEAAFDKKPFKSITELQKTMFDIVLTSGVKNCLTLIRNHPELAGREADEGRLTADSQKEQARAGLDQCTADELQQLRRLNKTYRDKFGFPFVIAVSGLNKHEVIAAMQSRIDNDNATEFTTSLDEIGKIAKIRLIALINEPY